MLFKQKRARVYAFACLDCDEENYVLVKDFSFLVIHFLHFLEVFIRALDPYDLPVFADPHYLGVMAFRTLIDVSNLQIHSSQPSK